MKTKLLSLILKALQINITIKELSVCGKNFQDTLLFKPPKDLSTFTNSQYRSIQVLTKKFMVLNGKVASTPTTLFMIILSACEFVFPTLPFMLRAAMQ